MSQQKQAADEGSSDDHPNSDAPIPANELVVVMGDEGGFNSVESYYIMANRALMCLP